MTADELASLLARRIGEADAEHTERILWHAERLLGIAERTLDEARLNLRENIAQARRDGVIR
jgi:hypothetical protein